MIDCVCKRSWSKDPNHPQHLASHFAISKDSIKKKKGGEKGKKVV
jgi:hypothetical protein